VQVFLFFTCPLRSWAFLCAKHVPELQECQGDRNALRWASAMCVVGGHHRQPVEICGDQSDHPELVRSERSAIDRVERVAGFFR
jgi:hypothetical protein